MSAQKPGPSDRKARVAALRAAEARHARDRRWLVGGLIGLLVLVVIGGIAVVIATNQSSSSPSGVPAHPRTTAEGRTTPPPWDAPADVAAAVKAAGLPMLGAEGTALHIHAHLDVYADGQPVTVPALVGIDEGAQRISPLHTHDPSGVIHVESPVSADFTLGQFLTEWQVSVSADHLGGLRTDATHTLTAYVDGKPVAGDPAAIRLNAHDEIALVYGTAAENASVTVPSDYAWPSGL
ncbi:YrzE family protein [Kitasatospora sp. NPDC127059]|uniref:YrzE family protein n=1 Tax=unclassified Kitasatospora TaxID=2633591 RepID=UPI00365A6C3B